MWIDCEHHVNRLWKIRGIVCLADKCFSLKERNLYGRQAEWKVLQLWQRGWFIRASLPLFEGEQPLCRLLQTLPGRLQGPVNHRTEITFQFSRGRLVTVYAHIGINAHSLTVANPPEGFRQIILSCFYRGTHQGTLYRHFGHPRLIICTEWIIASSFFS